MSGAICTACTALSPPPSADHPCLWRTWRTFWSPGFTNGTDLDDDFIAELVEVGGVHVNVSLDGFRPESHGTFRGSRESFFKTVDSIRRLSRTGLLQGLLCTP